MIPSEGSRGKQVSSPFPAYRSYWLAHDSKPLQPLLPHHIPSLPLTLLIPSYEDLCNDTGPTQIIQDNLPSSRSWTWYHNCKIPLINLDNIFTGCETRMWVPLRHRYSTYHICTAETWRLSRVMYGNGFWGCLISKRRKCWYTSM